MRTKTRFTLAVTFALLLTALLTSTVFAHSCTNVDKQSGAGSIGTYDANTDTFTPSGLPNGGFVTVIWGDQSYDIFIHTLLPNGALASGPDGVSQCDGHGIDFFWACVGG